MLTQNQYNTSFEDFVTPEVLDVCTMDEKETLKSVYTAVTNCIKQFGSDTIPTNEGTWRIDRQHFLTILASDPQKKPSILLNKRLGVQRQASVLVTHENIEFDDVYMMHPDTLRLATNIQKTLRDIL